MLMMTQAYYRKKQRGVVLIVGLIFMAILTIIGAAAMKTTLLDEKMAGNAHQQHLVFQAAEATLREAERCVEERLDFDNDNDPECESTDFNSTGSGGFYALEKSSRAAKSECVSERLSLQRKSSQLHR